VSYRKVIESIDGWEDLTEAEVIDAAIRQEHVYADPDRWTLLGFATIIGPEKVQPLIDFLGSIGLGWIASQAAAGGVPIGAADFNEAMRAIPHPSCQMLADRGRRMVSLCGLNKLPEVDAQIVAAWQGMKLEKTKAEKRRTGSSRWNNYAKAIDEWDGDPATEPVL
jgi:hypothetical protein